MTVSWMLWLLWKFAEKATAIDTAVDKWHISNPNVEEAKPSGGTARQ
jgi:hypothetical protein